MSKVPRVACGDAGGSLPGLLGGDSRVRGLRGVMPARAVISRQCRRPGSFLVVSSKMFQEAPSGPGPPKQWVFGAGLAGPLETRLL